MTNPFVIHVGDIANGATEMIDTSGPSPVRWGANLLAVEEDTQVNVHATVSNLGEAFMVHASVSGEASGTCARCLSPLSPEFSVNVNEVFGENPDFIDGDDAEEGDEPLLVEDNTVDISQLVIDEAGLNTPFSPTCENYGKKCQDSTPAPDGISEEVEQEDKPDPRWAGLEKFQLGDAVEDSAAEDEK